MNTNSLVDILAFIGHLTRLLIGGVLGLIAVYVFFFACSLLWDGAVRRVK